VAVAGLALGLSFALACAFVYVAPALPTAENMHSVELAVPLRVYSRSGALVSQIGEQRRIPVTFEEVPPLVWKAVLASEDDRFFEHHGIDWMGVLRAVVMNVATAGAGQGGSTISQQAARNMFLSLDKTARRKLSEVFVTYRMERDFTKEQILAIYLNVVPFGQRAYGIAAAAETYYGKRLDELTVAQAATLAGIIQRPSRQNPVTDPKAAAARRAYVLRRMVELGDIDEATAAAAAAEPSATRRFGPLSDVEAPYLAEMVRQEVVRRYGEAAVNAGYKVFTTLDERLQMAANRALALGLMEYDRRHGYRGALAKVKVPAGGLARAARRAAVEAGRSRPAAARRGHQGGRDQRHGAHPLRRHRGDPLGRAVVGAACRAGWHRRGASQGVGSGGRG
jgi:penicillin-binding protein 1A